MYLLDYVACRMLQVDPEKRVNFEQVQGHPWVQAVAAWVPQV